MQEPGHVQAKSPRVRDLFWSFLRLGMVAFGGPAMVSYIKQLAVTTKRWVTEEEFLEGVALCQAVPGATAMQCVAFVGLRTRKLAGAVAAYVGFGLPAFLLILVLAVAYQFGGNLHAVTAVMAGLRTFVVALVANSAWMFGRSSVRTIWDGLFSLITGALFFGGGSPFLIVAGAGLFGAFLFRGHGAPTISEPGPHLGWHTLYPAALVLAFGTAMVAILFVVNRPLAILALIMMKVDFFAFGGGFASIPLMFREIVNIHGWVPGHVFMDGIALGQVTPGPIVIVATFVGYQTLHFAGAVVGTVGIFLPSLLAVVLVEPWFRRLRASALFQGALRGLVLSFVGLLVSVTIQFARLAPWSIPSSIIFALGMLALLRKVPIPWIVVAVALASALFL